MGVVIQAAFRRPSGGVPSPADGDKSVPWWWDHLAAQARELRRSGFSAVLLPPVLKTQSGAFPATFAYRMITAYLLPVWRLPATLCLRRNDYL